MAKCIWLDLHLSQGQVICLLMQMVEQVEVPDDHSHVEEIREALRCCRYVLDMLPMDDDDN